MTGFGQNQKRTKNNQLENVPKAEEFIKKSISAYQHGELLNAKNLLQKAIMTNQTNSFALGFLATIEKTLGNAEKAARLFESSLKLDQTNPDFLHNYSGLILREDLTKAIKISDKALDISPNNSRYLERNGYLRWKAGDLENALKKTIKALKINPNLREGHMNLAGIYKDLGKLDQALASALNSIALNPNNSDAHMYLAGIHKELGKLDQALASALNSIALNPNNSDAHMYLAGIHKDLGNLDQAIAYSLRSLELQPDNPSIYIILSNIYQDLGNHDKALAFILESLKLKPEGSEALCELAQINIARGQTREAKKILWDAISFNTQEYQAYYALSTMLDTEEEAKELAKSITSVQSTRLCPLKKSFVAFSLSNCFHKIKSYDQASEQLRLANENKLKILPSSEDTLQREIKCSLLTPEVQQAKPIESDSGKKRIFIVGMPRSGSTLLETILSMNPKIKGLGESRSLQKAIAKFRQATKYSSKQKNLNELYSQLEPINDREIDYTIDKNLYNFLHIKWIAEFMPASKIIRCRRHPMDNILSMFRSNLMTGNNYTSCLEDAANILIAQEKSMQIHKESYPRNIFTFEYDKFVDTPKTKLLELLEWLNLDFTPFYLYPEKSTRSITTASAVQARKPINNNSVGSWRNYEKLLKPALAIIQECDLFTK